MSRARLLRKTAARREHGAPTPREWKDRKRRRLACRATHWRRLVAAVQAHDMRRPIDMDARVGFLVTRCRECRTAAQAPVVITADEELNCTSVAVLIDGRVRRAAETLWDVVVPTSVRRRRRCPWVVGPLPWLLR